MTTRASGRTGGGIDFRREAETAAAAAGLSVEEWVRTVLETSGPSAAAVPPAHTEAAVMAPQPVDRILSSLDRIGERIRTLSAATASSRGPAVAQPEAAPEVQPDPRARPHVGIDLQKAIEEIARKRDALDRTAARPQPERPAAASVDPAEIAALRQDVAAIRLTVEAGDAPARLRSLEEGYDEVVRRLDQLRGAIDNPRTVADLVQRLAEIRRLLAQAPTDSQLAVLSERIDRIDVRLGHVSYDQDIADLTNQVATLAVAVSGLDPAGLVNVIDARLDEVSGQVAGLERRLGGLDGVGRLQESVDRQAAVLSAIAQRSEQVPRIAHEMERQSALVDGVAQNTEHLPNLVTDFAALRGSLDAEATRSAENLGALFARLDDFAGPSGIGRLQDSALRQEAAIDALASQSEELPRMATSIAALQASVDAEQLRSAENLDAVFARIEDLVGPAGIGALREAALRHQAGLDAIASQTTELPEIARQIERQTAIVDDMARNVDALPAFAADLADVRGDLDSINRRTEALPEIAREIDEQTAALDGVSRGLDKLDPLASDIAALRDRLDAEALRREDELAVLISRIEGIGARLGEVPTAERLAAIVEEQMAEVTVRIDALDVALEPQELASLEATVKELSERIDQRISELAAPKVVDLPAELAESLARIETHLADDREARRMTVLEEKIAGIAASVHSLDRLAPTDIAPLEKAVADIRAEIAGIAPPSLAGLESEVRSLTDMISRVESTSLDGVQFERLDRRISDIAERIDRAPLEAAALDAALARFEKTLATAVGGTMRSDFAALKTELRGSAERDRSLLIAIGEAVERLSTERRDAPAGAVATEPPPHEKPVEDAGAWSEINRALGASAHLREAAVRPEPPLVADARQDAIVPEADDRPLEPGSGKPRQPAERSELSKADFIAAARRAAQAASAPQPAVASTRPATRAAQPLKGDSKPRSFLGRYRRSLLATAAALVVLIAGGRALTIYLAGETPTGEPPEIASLPAPSDDAGGITLVPPQPEPTPVTEDNAAATSPPVSEGAPAARDVAAAAEPGELVTAAPVAPAPSFAPAGEPPAVGVLATSAPDTSDQTASLPSSVKATPPPESLPATPEASGPAPALPDGFGPPALATAAGAGDPAAAFEIAARLTEGRGTERDMAAAAAWYRRAAEAGIVVAEYRLGSFYEKGQGVPRDLAEARNWYGRAAEAGNAKAMHNLAVLSADGSAGTPDYEAAAKWFTTAAENGVRDSQYNLAILYAKGLGVTRDLTLSYMWFAIAAAGGDDDAAKKRDDVAQVLDKDSLARARLAVETWKQKSPDPAANDVPKGDPSWFAVPEETAAVAVDPIAKAQGLLAAQGYDPGPADGRMGERTRLAIEAFQKKHGLAVTGTVDEALLQALGERRT